MRFAYADPPYPGEAKKHYGSDEVDHVELIAGLVDGFPDGWALSTKTPSLMTILPMCPKSVRVAAWVKPFAIFKPGVNPAYAWEPVIFMGGRKRNRKQPTIRDWHSANITLKRGLCGVKPDSFNHWILDLLGWQPGDEMVDLFPGSGGMERIIGGME